MMNKPTPQQLKEKIFREGKIEVEVQHSHMLQKIEFVLKKEPFGRKSFYYLYTDREVDSSSLIKLAEELDIPVQGSSGRFFPKNKNATDFLI